MKATPTIIAVGTTLLAILAMATAITIGHPSLIAGIIWPVFCTGFAWAWRMAMQASIQWKKNYEELTENLGYGDAEEL